MKFLFSLIASAVVLSAAATTPENHQLKVERSGKVFTRILESPNKVNKANAISGNGVVTYQMDLNYGFGNPDLGDPISFEVTASYEDGVLTINGMQDDWGELNPIEFEIDLSTGEAVATEQLASVEDYGGDLYYNYYGAVATLEPIVNATFENIDDSQSLLTIEPWGLIQDFGQWYIINAFYNTEVVFDFAIENDPGITNIESITQGNNSSHIFNLQGVEIKDPKPGNIYIKVSGTKSEKIIF